MDQQVSYCRFGQSSDVYIFGSMEKLECNLAWKVAHFDQLPMFFSVPYSEDGTHWRTMIGHLYFLRHHGVRVPEYAIARMLRELEEIYYDMKEAEEDLLVAQKMKEEGDSEAR